jgi:hypothetical protein
MNLSPAQFAQRIANVTRIAETRRAKTHCKNGHEFTQENTLVRHDNGCRDCRTCKQDRSWYSDRGLGRFTA